MSRAIITTSLFLFSLAGLYAQSLQTSTYLERTHVGPKVGTSIGFNTKGEIELGGFYQRAVDMIEPEPGRPLRKENTFCGAYFGYPLLNDYHFKVKLNVRTGVTNGENFVITPSLLGSVSPFPMIKISTGVGVRAFKPTFMASLSLNLNNQGKQLLAEK